MALLHQATIHPTKDQIVGPWLRTRPWWDGIDERGPVGTFRLDDPAGEVGIECFLFGSSEGSTLFVPLTYRGAELHGGGAHLLGTMQHSVLGERWVYDGCADPVFVSTVLDTIRTGGSQADLVLHRSDGGIETREPTAHVRGSGGDFEVAEPGPSALSASDDTACTRVQVDGLTLAVVRRVGADLPDDPTLVGSLVGSFAGGDDLVLATVS